MADVVPKRFYKRILACGLLVNLAWVLLVDTQPYSDFLYYHQLAGQIAAGGQWGDTYTTVGYPIALGLVYFLFGTSLFVAKAFNICLTFLNGLLLIAIISKLDLREAWKRFLFVLVVFFPATIYYTSVTGNEILFTTTLLAATAVCLGTSARKYVWIGVLVAMGTMIKPFFLAFFLVVVLSDYLGFGDPFSRSLRNGLVVLSVSVLMLSPWLVRNSILMGRPTYVSSNGGLVLYINNNSTNSTGMWMPLEEIRGSLALTPAYASANWSQRNAMLGAAARRWIVSHPARFLSLGALRLANTYLRPGDLDYSLYGSSLSMAARERLLWEFEHVRLPVFLLGYLSMLVYGLVFVVRLLRHQRGEEGARVLLLATFCMFAAVHFVFEGQARYAYPTVFIVAFFFVDGASTLVDYFRHRRGEPIPRPAHDDDTPVAAQCRASSM